MVSYGYLAVGPSIDKPLNIEGQQASDLVGVFGSWTKGQQKPIGDEDGSTSGEGSGVHVSSGEGSEESGDGNEVFVKVPEPPLLVRSAGF